MKFHNNTQKHYVLHEKSTFTNTLLQDITIFNGSDSSQLENWLIDVETAADLTSQSRTKLAQAKYKGLTDTLISEAQDLDKSWVEIKDLLHLKICTLDIHTSVSHFMEIQQKEKESLAAYMHRFKREAKRCNFTNNTTTIHIFVKGLKNTHTLAAHVYEKGPQTLSDAISEVEKLQAAQQLTATLLPSSTVNMMSNEGDKCFQCQELGHITQHCPNTRCFDCNEYGHVAADCPDRIPPSGTPAHQKRHCSNTRHHTRLTSRHCHRDRHRYNRSRSQSYSHSYQSHSWNSSDLHRGCSRSYHRCPNRSTSCSCHSSSYCYCCNMPHRRSSTHRSSLTHSRDCSRSRTHIPYKPSETASSKLSSSRTTVKHQDMKHKKVTIDEPQSEYYSSNDALSDSEVIHPMNKEDHPWKKQLQ